MILSGSNFEFNPPLTPLAFFDLDGTITDTFTDWIWAKWRATKSLKGVAEAAWLITMVTAYHRGQLDARRLIKYHRWRVGGREEMWFRAFALRFFIEKGEEHIFKEAIRLIQAQKEIGSRVVMITSQHEIIAAPFAQRLGMDELVASQLEIKNGKFGEPVKPYCYQEGKVYWATRCAANARVSLSECAFFTDSINDMPLLAAVGHPVAVNPDPALKIEAHKNRWASVYFSAKNT